MIELLAVIVIMGILMVVAIPAVTRTIENTRKDTYLSTAKQYVNQVKTLWAADGLKCNGSSVGNTSAIAPGNYYITTDSLNDNILEEGGKSPWKKETAGVVYVHRVADGDTYKNDYSIYLVDASGNFIGNAADSLVGVGYDALARSKVSKLATNTYELDTSVTPNVARVTLGANHFDTNYTIRCEVDE